MTDQTDRQDGPQAAWQALPYTTPQEMVAAFNSGIEFILHYHGKTFDVTSMEARHPVVYVWPPGLPVKVRPNGSSAEGDSGRIWLTHAQSRDAAEGVEDAEWCRQAKLTLEHLGGFLQKTGAPHRVDWREWIDSADKHLGLKWPSDIEGAAPPKPAPDAVRERAKALADELAKIKAFPETFSRGNHNETWRVSLGIRDRSDRDLIVSVLLALSAPVPPADGARWQTVPVEPTLEMQKAGYEALKLFFPHVDEAESPMGHYRIYEAMLAVAPSPAVAAEPVAWRWRYKAGDRPASPWKLLDSEGADKWNWSPALEFEPLYATPPVSGDREVLQNLANAMRFVLAFYEPGQRTLDTNAWKSAEAGARHALKDADAILSLPVQPGAEERSSTR